jgi:DeoR/GlpR family transcriptional regulator of sugar metabolism
MLIAERQSRLQELIARRGMSDLDTLADELNVSQSTIRRDIEIIEQRGLVQRTLGGVIWLGDRNAPRLYAFDQRQSFQTDAKRRIAQAAAKLVQPGQTILIDGGTTTYYLAEQLAGRSLQIITNSLPIASLFLNSEETELILTGGLLYPRHGVLLGPMADNALANIHAQTMFMSVAGLYDGKLFNQNLLMVTAEQRMMRQSQEVILLMDSTKFGQKALAELCDLSAIHTVICDAAPPAADRRRIEQAGCRLQIAKD